MLANKAYVADTLIEAQTPGNHTVIPKTNRTIKRACDFVLYCERNLIERSFNKSSTFAPSRPGTTNSTEIFSPQFKLVSTIILLNQY